MDLTAPVTYRMPAEFRHWPKCYRCSLALGYVWPEAYPVEHFGIAGRERAEGSLGVLYTLVIEVKCSHGEANRRRLEAAMGVPKPGKHMQLVVPSVSPKYTSDNEQRIRLEARRAWGPTTEQIACSRVLAFAPGKPGHHGVQYRPGENRERHRLETSVR